MSGWQWKTVPIPQEEFEQGWKSVRIPKSGKVGRND